MKHKQIALHIVKLELNEQTNNKNNAINYWREKGKDGLRKV